LFDCEKLDALQHESALKAANEEQQRENFSLLHIQQQDLPIGSPLAGVI
jgi:hypothetical protein